VQNEVLCTAV